MVKFIIQPCGRGMFHFVMKSDRGVVILTSEVFKKSYLAYRAIKSVVFHKVDDNNYQRVNTSDGKWFFVFTTSVGEVIGVSELMDSLGEVEKMINKVKRTAKQQRILLSF